MSKKRQGLVRVYFIILFCCIGALLIGAALFWNAEEQAFISAEVSVEQSNDELSIAAPITSSADSVRVETTVTAVKGQQVIDRFEQQLSLTEGVGSIKKTVSTLEYPPGSYVVTVKATAGTLQNIAFQSFTKEQAEEKEKSPTTTEPKDTSTPQPEETAPVPTEEPKPPIQEPVPELPSEPQQIEPQSCDEMDDVSRDECYLEEAVALDDEANCEKIGTPQLRDGCYAFFAIDGDLSDCDSIQDAYQKSVCETFKGGPI